jgi:hypothetical protein
VLPISARMLVIYRTAAEPFTTTVTNSFKKLPFTCAINAIQYSIDTSAYASAVLGNPDDASDTTPDGIVVNQGKILGGRAAPRMFYMVNDPLGGYSFGEGDPPQVGMSGVGGAGPIIINGLPYGIGNRCRLPAACAPTGPIPSQYADSVEQRNNATYAAQQGKAPSTGKTIVATNKKVGKLLILVQPNGKTGLSFDDIKAGLMVAGCDNAVFLDGSDSSMLNAGGILEVRPAQRKDDTNTIGLAFYV